MSAPLDVHEAHGVRWGEGGVPRSYGDAAAEYRAAREACVVVDRCDRTIVRLHGRDPLRILQGIVTNDVASAPAGRAVYAALLTAKGRMVSELRILREGADFLLELPAAALPALLETLRRTVPPLFARFEALDVERHVLGVYGPQATSHLASVLDTTLPPAERDAHAQLAHEGHVVHVIGGGSGGHEGYDVVAPTAHAAVLWQRLVERGVQPLGHAPLDVLRIEAGEPQWGAELTESTIPLEAGLTRAISTSKGCYTGQEVIIRILHRGHVNWQLRGVLLGSTPGPARDAQLVHPESGKVVGRITSSAWSPRHDQEIALAYVRREVEPPAELVLGSADGARVQVVSLPVPG